MPTASDCDPRQRVLQRERGFCRPGRAAGSGGSVDHRYYDPVTGQFLNVDPEVRTTGAAYFYAGDNPVTGVDPLGLSCSGSSAFLNHIPLGGSVCNVVRDQSQSLATGLTRASNITGTFGAAGSAAILVGLIGLPEDAEVEGGIVGIVSGLNDFAAGTELLGCLLDRHMSNCTLDNLGLDVATLVSPTVLNFVPADIRRAAEVEENVLGLLNWLHNNLGAVAASQNFRLMAAGSCEVGVVQS